MEMTIPVLVWFVLGVVCFLLEMALPGFIIFFFGIGAFVTAIAVWLVNPLGINSQLLLFLVASVGSLFALRGVVKRTFIGGTSQDEEVDRLVQPGETAEVLVDIKPPAEGKILYSGTQWRASADQPIEAGELVSIVSQDGLLMHVKVK
jgi:inner membrane protein